ncbi:helicase associated domain-containing protein [Arthrobacter sp. ov407]|uniref:helicase associated domain-containing protein n=1 Tax=Arthrobacter sp. ov407 TaxID=1761748 RepID=UPI003523D856
MQADHEANRPTARSKPLRTSWLLNINELLEVLEAEGRYPSSSDQDPQRRRLGYWLSVQRRAHRDGRLTQAKLSALDVLPAWNENQRAGLAQERWRERLGELQAFTHEHRRWPRFRNPTSEAERVLGVWLHAQRQKASRASMSDAEMRLLEGCAPGWYTWTPKSSR